MKLHYQSVLGFLSPAFSIVRFSLLLPFNPINWQEIAWDDKGEKSIAIWKRTTHYWRINKFSLLAFFWRVWWNWVFVTFSEISTLVHISRVFDTVPLLQWHYTRKASVWNPLIMYPNGREMSPKTYRKDIRKKEKRKKVLKLFPVLSRSMSLLTSCIIFCFVLVQKIPFPEKLCRNSFFQKHNDWWSSAYVREWVGVNTGVVWSNHGEFQAWNMEVKLDVKDFSCFWEHVQRRQYVSSHH